MYKLTVAVFAAAAAFVHAQDSTTASPTTTDAGTTDAGTGSGTSTATSVNPTETSTYPPCILNCTVSSLSAGNCTSGADFACICTSSAFQAAASLCITQNCPELLNQAGQLQTTQCGLFASTASQSSTGAVPTSITTSHNAGFQTANIAAGVTLALFGAAISLL